MSSFREPRSTSRVDALQLQRHLQDAVLEHFPRKAGRQVVIDSFNDMDPHIVESDQFLAIYIKFAFNIL
jgi:hypothetical protein